jgi:hypothetical protein
MRSSSNLQLPDLALHSHTASPSNPAQCSPADREDIRLQTLTIQPLAAVLQDRAAWLLWEPVWLRCNWDLVPKAKHHLPSNKPRGQWL